MTRSPEPGVVPPREGPTRMCAVTRRRAPRDAMIRLVASPEGEVCVDARGNLPGRGAWIQPDRQAMDALVRRSAGLARALGVPVQGEQVVDAIQEACLRAVLDGLSISQAAGVLVPGQERVVRAVQDGRVDLVMVAEDIVDRTRAMVTRAAESSQATVVSLPVSSAQIGEQIGRPPTGVLGVGPARPARHLRRWLRRISALG